MALLNVYLYLLFIDLANFHTWKLDDTTQACLASRVTFVITLSLLMLTSLPKVIWEQGRVAAAVPGAGWHKGLRIRNVCIVFVKDGFANVRYFRVRKQE